MAMAMKTAETDVGAKNKPDREFGLEDFDALLLQVKRVRRDCDRALARSYNTKNLFEQLTEETEEIMGNYQYSTPEEMTISHLQSGGDMSQIEIEKVVTMRVTVRDTLFGADAVDYCADPDAYDEALLEEVNEWDNIEFPGKDVLMVQGMDVDEWDNIYGVSRHKRDSI